MGGAREAKVAAKKADGKEQKLGELRFHESGGQVHFHDDKNKLKVAIQAGRWYQEWQNAVKAACENGMAAFQYRDHINKSQLTLQVTLSDGQLDISEISIAPLTSSDTFKKLDEFTIR